MVANRDNEALSKVTVWLCSREGVMLLKWNVDLVSDIQAKKLLSQVDSFKDDDQEAAPVDDVLERLKDRGEVITGETVAKPACSDRFTLIVRNASLGQASPEGWKAFASTYSCVSNGTISVLQARSPASLNKPLAELLASGLSREEDYVLLEPACFRCRAMNPKRKRVARSTGLHASWLSMETGWLNANVEGRFCWRQSIRKAKCASKSQMEGKHGVTRWISRILRIRDQ